MKVIYILIQYIKLSLKAFNESEEIADAVNFPNIRLFSTSRNWSNKTEYDLLGVDLDWSMPNRGKLLDCFANSLHCQQFAEKAFDMFTFVTFRK